MSDQINKVTIEFSERIPAILNFWFQDTAVKGISTTDSKRWFSRDANLDTEIRDLFLSDWELAADRKHESWLASAQGSLALIILLDQFSRNLFRDQAAAFSQDEYALSITLKLIETGLDLNLSMIERVFAYLPLEHSESLAMQERSIVQYTQLVATASPAEKTSYASFLKYAQAHKAIIDRFGRYPHRNKSLGRVSSAEEIQFLAQENSGF